MKISNQISDFFLDVFNFFKGRSVLGVDFGTTSIKIAELSEIKGKLILNNYGILETKEYLNHPNKALQTSSLPLDEMAATKYLKILLNEMKPKSNLVIAGVPAFASFSTVLDMPLMSEAEIAKAVMFQAPQYIPLKPGEALIDWIKIDEFNLSSNQKYLHVLVIGISKKLVETYKKIFKNVGLKLIFLEFDGLALVRSLIDPIDRDTLIVDIGAEETEIFVTSNGNLAYTGGTSYSGIHLTQTIGRSLGISSLRAESLKRKKGTADINNDLELAGLTLPFLDVIIQEANHIADIYKRRYGKIIERVMVVGGGANLLGIGKYFAKQTGLLEAKPNVFRNVGYNLVLEPIVRNLNNELALAIGLAEKYFI